MELDLKACLIFAFYHSVLAALQEEKKGKRKRGQSYQEAQSCIAFTTAGPVFFLPLVQSLVQTNSCWPDIKGLLVQSALSCALTGGDLSKVMDLQWSLLVSLTLDPREQWRSVAQGSMRRCDYPVSQLWQAGWQLGHWCCMPRHCDSHRWGEEEVTDQAAGHYTGLPSTDISKPDQRDRESFTRIPPYGTCHLTSSNNNAAVKILLYKQRWNIIKTINDLFSNSC